MKIHSASIISGITSIIIMMTIASVQANDLVAKSYDIENVSEVIVNGGGRLQLVQGETESLHVEANKDVIDRVVVDLSGEKLTLSIKNSNKGFNFFHWFDNNRDEATYILQLKKLKFLGVTGASHATLGSWRGKSLDVKASGAAEISFANIAFDELFIELSGASNARAQEFKVTKAKFELSGAANMDVKAAGQTKLLNVGASGASNFRGKLLTVAQADVNASGASNIELAVTEFLKADASGASNIRYIGQPKLQSNASGASHVNSISN
jgi:hypothetical protein